MVYSKTSEDYQKKLRKTARYHIASANLEKLLSRLERGMIGDGDNR